MGRRAWSAILMIALLQTASAQAEECGLIRLASFDIAPDGVIVVPVAINDKEKQFLVDTGGFASSISPGVVEELKLSQHHMTRGVEAVMNDGTLIDHFVWADTVRLGVGIAKEVPLIVQPQQSKVGIEKFDGTLAPDVLPNFGLDFDFGHNKFNLMAPQHCPGAVVYWADSFTEIPFVYDLNRHIVVHVSLNGLNTLATIDTGAEVTNLSEFAARKYFGLKDSDVPKPSSDDKSLIQYGFHFDTLSLGGVVVRNPEVAILPDEMAKSMLEANHHRPSKEIEELMAIPVTIGLNVLRKLHVYVDYKEMKLYITGANATRASSPAPLAGSATAQ